MKKIYKLLSFKSKRPKTFGLYHLISVSTTAFLTTMLCKKCKSATERTERRIALSVWLALVVLEIYKQFVNLFEIQENALILSYNWNSFPFQLCSAPLYILPLIAFLPSGNLRESIVSFFGTFVLLGGLAVCIYPGNVFVNTLGINIHTMIWHGSQVFLGIYFNLRRFFENKDFDLKKYFNSAVPIFLIFVTIALLLNVGLYHVLTLTGNDSTFNMFFISPYFECLFPVLKLIQAYTPYPVFLFSYIISLTVFAYILLLSEYTAVKKINSSKSKNKNTV